MPDSTEAAIAGFLELMRRLQERAAVPGAQLLDWAARFYREVRVPEADLDRDGDMLLLQWGRLHPWLLTQPTDLRGAAEPALATEAIARRYFNVTRQVVPRADADPDAFDDTAVQLSLTLVYDPADGSEPSATLWVQRPAELDTGLERVRRDPFVTRLLRRPPVRLVATVDHAG